MPDNKLSEYVFVKNENKHSYGTKKVNILYDPKAPKVNMKK